MKKYMISIISNYIVGSFSLNPLIYSIVSLNGGLVIFGPTVKPTLLEVFWGSFICLLIVVVLLTLNLFIYFRFKEKNKHPRLLFITGFIFFLLCLFSFTIGIYAPDIFNIM